MSSPSTASVLISPYVHTELKKLLVRKEELVTDLTNLVYRRTDDVEKLSKIKADADKQLVKDMTQIKDLAAERDLQELADLKTAVQAVVDMVDPIEGGEAGGKSLVERLREAPQKITGFLSETSRQYAAHVLGLVTSYWPGANSTPLGDGLSTKCSDEKFAKYLDEANPLQTRSYKAWSRVLTLKRRFLVVLELVNS